MLVLTAGLSHTHEVPEAFVDNLAALYRRRT